MITEICTRCGRKYSKDCHVTSTGLCDHCERSTQKTIIVKTSTNLRLEITQLKATIEKQAKILKIVREFIADCAVSHNEARYLYRAKVLQKKLEEMGG